MFLEEFSPTTTPPLQLPRIINPTLSHPLHPTFLMTLRYHCLLFLPQFRSVFWVENDAVLVRSGVEFRVDVALESCGYEGEGFG